MNKRKINILSLIALALVLASQTLCAPDTVEAKIESVQRFLIPEGVVHRYNNALYNIEFISALDDIFTC